MLPNGWKIKPLGQIARISSGGTPNRSESSYWGGNIPWVTTGEIRFNTITNTVERITEAGLKNSSAKIYPAGTLLMAMYGEGKTRGQVAKLGIAATTNQNSAAILLASQHDPDFFFHYLSWKYESIREFGNSGGLTHLNAELLKEITAPVPPYEEQSRIAKVLSVWDEAISTTERLLANSRKQKLALLAATLHAAPATGDVAVRSDNGGFPLSVQPGIPKLPRAPNNWRCVRLGEHLKEVRRPVSLESNDGYTLVTVKRSRGGVQKREVRRGSEIKTRPQFSVQAGDFLISKRQIVHGACGIVPPELDGALVSNEYAVINSDGEIDLGFLRYLSESRYFQQTCFHSSIGVQKRLVKILDAATREVELIEGQLASQKKEKHALMAQLLTGKRRVRLPESASKATA